MTENGLDSLLGALDADAQGGPERGCVGPESGTALVVSCSMGNCQDDLSLWPVDPSWNAQFCTTLGAQAWTRHEGELVVDETLRHVTADRDVDAILVVGHTGCDVLAEAYERCLVPTEPSPAGISARLDPLVSLVERAVDAGVVGRSMPLRRARHRLVEYTVVRQVEFLTERLPASTTVVGYVHDQDGVYDSFPGTQYLVSVDGETDTAELDGRLPDTESTSVGNLCR